MAKIFISYSRDSQDIVEELVQDLNDDDHETWFDQRLTGGQSWWDKILCEIRICDIFVAALTPDSLDSLACQRELKYADLLQKPLCPVRLSDKVRPDALPHRLAELQWVDYCHRDKLAFKNLQRTIRGLPKAPPLPDPLPDPPAVPRSYLSTLRERIDIDSPLELREQAQLVFELRGSFRDGGAAEEITDLLQRLKTRDELFAKVAREIDELLGDINRGQRGSLSSREREPLRGSTSFVEAFPKPVMEGATKEEAEKIKAPLEKAGTKVELKSASAPQEVHENQVRAARPASRTVTRELIMAVAAELGSLKNTWYTPNIPVYKANNARASMKMPADESILVLFDATFLGSAKEGLLIGLTGLYSRSSPQYRSWEEFLANPVERVDKLLHIGAVGLNVGGRFLSCGVIIESVLTFLTKLRARALDGQ